MTHQKQRTGKKEDQSHSTVICSVHMVSIRVYIELLKSYSHLIMQLGVALISSDTFLRLQTCRVESQSISSMKRPSAHSHLRNFCDWDQRVTNMLLHNQARPCKAGILSAWMVSVSAATRAIDLPCPKKHKKQFSLLLFCARLPFYSFLIQFQLIIALRILQIALFHNSSSEKRRRIGGCQHENVRSYVSVNVVLCKKTF